MFISSVNVEAVLRRAPRTWRLQGAMGLYLGYRKPAVKDDSGEKKRFRVPEGMKGL
jgi:hypothetical protein